MQDGLQQCWRSAQRWRSWIWAQIHSAGAESLAEVQGQCAEPAHLNLHCLGIGADGASRLAGLQERCNSAQRWLTSISNTMASKMSGKGGLEFRGVVQPLAFVCRHLPLLAICHLFGRQATRQSDKLCTYSVVAFGLVLSSWAEEESSEVWINGMIFIWFHRFGSLRPWWKPVWLFLSFQVSHEVGRKAGLNAALHSKLHFKRKREKEKKNCPSTSWYIHTK